MNEEVLAYHDAAIPAVHPQFTYTYTYTYSYTSVNSLIRSLDPQRSQRLDGGGPSRRQPARDNCDTKQDDGHRRKRGRIRRTHLIKQPAQQARERERRNDAERNTAEREPRSLAHDHVAHIRRARAEHDADAELVRAPADEIRDDTVEPDRAKEERGSCGDNEQQHGKTRARHRVGDDALQRAHVRDGKVRIQLAHDLAHRGRQRRRRHTGADHERGVTWSHARIHGRLEQGHVDDLRGSAADVLLRYVRYDAGDGRPRSGR